MDVTLTLVTKDGMKKKFQLPSSVTVIGRRQDCDLCIPLMNVSRRHCEINEDEGQLKVRDLGSRNGTFLNGDKIGESQINSGDHLSIGPLEFTVEYSMANGSRQADKQKITTEFLKEQGAYDASKGSNETEIMEGFSQ